MSKKFIVSWDHHGLESCRDISKEMNLANQCNKENLFAIIIDPDNEPPNEHVRTINKHVHVLMLRARYNPQRHYEIYSFDTEDGVTEDDIGSWFDDSPQQAADRVREIGVKLYSDRAAQNNIKIT